MQVVRIEIQHHAHPLDFSVRVDWQRPGLPQVGHVPGQALDQFRRRLGAGSGIGPPQIVGSRRIEPIRVGEQTDRSRRLIQEPLAQPAAALLVL